MGYRSISLPSTLVEELEKHLESTGYSSIAEAVKDAVRRRLDELNSRIHSGESGTEEAPINAQ